VTRHLVAEKIPAGDVRHPVPGGDPLALRSLPRAWRSEHDDAHRWLALPFTEVSCVPDYSCRVRRPSRREHDRGQHYSCPVAHGLAAAQRQTLEAVAPSLRCPVCAGPVRVAGGQVSCCRGHSFDIARQGYVTLAGGQGGPGTGDSATMVMARESFLAAGHYQPLADALAELAVPPEAGPAGLVIDLAGGTGYYLAHVLNRAEGRLGGVTRSRPAARRPSRRAG
jgi:hypothetical protein